MVAHIETVAFQGIEASPVDVQVHIGGGLPAFMVVGLPDKAVAESRERVRGALAGLGLALPAKRITVNLAPAYMQKEGSHFDLPIALGLLVAMEVLAADDLATYVALGELGLDGALIPVTGVLPAAIGANARERGLICPAANGAEAAWAGGGEVVAPTDLLALINHFKGTQLQTPPRAATLAASPRYPDIRDIKVLAADDLATYVALGELGLDGALIPVTGVLPAAIGANARERGLICPAANGAEAAWAGGGEVVAPTDLLALINHFKGTQLQTPPRAATLAASPRYPDIRDIKGQETAKRALEIAAAGGHNLLMIGPPGTGKSMLASRLPGILPPLAPEEALSVSMIASVAGLLGDNGLTRSRPFRDPHHSASMAAMVGGGTRARPGEVSLAHLGVLFMDELPEFPRPVLDALRQPIESGAVAVARANAHVRYPARFQLVAAMNPCRCGYLSDPARACSRAPHCARDYQVRISGPLYDRIDLHVEVPELSAADLTLPPPAEGSVEVAARVAAARKRQRTRFQATDATPDVRTNAEAEGETLTRIATLDEGGQALLAEATDRLRLSARGHHRVLKVARTIADLAGAETVARRHIAEALSYRRIGPYG